MTCYTFLMSKKLPIIVVLVVIVFLVTLMTGPFIPRKYRCNDGKWISIRGTSTGVAVSLSDGRDFSLGSGSVAASYRGMKPYYVGTDGSPMLKESDDGAYSFSEAKGSALVEAYSNCR